MQAVPDERRRRALIFLSFGVVSFGVSGVLIKLCRYSPAVIASFRMILAGAVLTPFCIGAWRRFLGERGLAGVLLLLVPGVLLGLHFQAWVAGLKLTTVAAGTFIFSINPVFFALAERVVRRRRVPPYALAALGLVVAGAAWLFWVKEGRAAPGGHLRGDLLCLLSTLLFVVYLFVSRWVTTRTRAARAGSPRSVTVEPVPGSVPHALYIHVLYLGGGLATLPFALAGGELARTDLGDTASALALLGLALLPTLIGHSANNYAVRFLPPLTVSFFTLAEPVLATAAAALVLTELPAPAEVPTYALFLCATVFYLVRSRGGPLEQLPREKADRTVCGKGTPPAADALPGGPGRPTSDRRTGSSR
jgi:drug/metabolite transporter (DMT)-like permease